VNNTTKIWVMAQLCGVTKVWHVPFLPGLIDLSFM